MGKIGKQYHSILKVDVANSSSINGIQNFNLGTFLWKISDIFPFVCSWFHPFFPLRKSCRWYICFMSDKTDVILAVALKPIGAKAQYILYIKKSKVSSLLLTAFFCCYIRLALTPPWGFFKICLVDTILEIHPWSLCLHRDLLQYLERRENYLLVFLILCR